MARTNSIDFQKIQTIAFFAVLIGVGFLFIKLIYPYVFAIFWAAVIATIFHPVYRRIVKHLRNEEASAAISVVLVILIVLIPMSGILGIVANQAVQTYNDLNNPQTIENVQSTIENILHSPVIEKYVGDVNVADRLRAASSTITSTGVEWLKVGAGSTISAIINLAIMLYSLYYFFKDGPRWLKRLMHLLPFGDNNEKVLYEKFASTSKATLKGTILLGGIQGTVGGIFFVIVGLPSAAFWGLIMIVLSIIPAGGAAVVWFPAFIYLLATGQIWQAFVLLAGGLLIGLLDNLLRPPLVGKDIQMHPVLILLSTIGGIAMYGISGVVIGPMVAAFFFAILQMYEARYKRQLDSAST